MDGNRAQQLNADDPITPETTRELRWALLKVRVGSLQQIESIRERLLESQSHGNAREARILNVMLVIALFVYELAASVDGLLAHREGHRVRLYAKHVIVHVYETSNTLKLLLGTQFQADLDAAGFGQLWGEAARRAHRGFGMVYDRAHPLYEDVRHGIGGHREESGEERFRLLERIDAQGAADVAILSVEATKDLSALITQYMRTRHGPRTDAAA